MSVDFLYFYLGMFWVMSILYKDNWLHNKIEALANATNSGFLWELGQCKFCLDNWFGSFAAICTALYLWDWKVLFWGIFFATISAHFRK